MAMAPCGCLVVCVVLSRVLSGEDLGSIIDDLQQSDATERLQNFIAQAQKK